MAIGSWSGAMATACAFTLVGDLTSRPASRASLKPQAQGEVRPARWRGIVYDEDGMPSFDLIRSKQHDREASLVAFDLLELDGEDVSKDDLLARKLRLKVLVGRLRAGIEYNDHIEGNGAEIFAAARRLGHEGDRRETHRPRLREWPVETGAKD
jgi:bifunctional non-homologous end joining protein LigD